MVFPSVPIYLDPPTWQQHQQNHQPGGSSENPQHHQSSSLSPATAASGSSSGSLRPTSMADRARLAKVPQPEASLKCPRCESTNTKFCYFNNYSLSQPRHFCKTCRRYWTRGGALRNVPVGGGCRRNKRSKSSNSKSPQVPSASSGAIPTNTCTEDLIGHIPQPPHQVPFMPSLHHLSDYSGGDTGLNFAGIQAASDMDFHMSTILPEQWRLQQVQQFPFLTGLEPPAPGLYPFDGEGVEQGYEGSGASQIRSRPSGSGVNQIASVKMEESQQGLNLSRQFLGIPGHDQYWSTGSAWTDLSNFTPSSTSHLL